VNAIESLAIDVYPWAEPTAEQRARFDALTTEEKRRVILAAVEEGFASPLSDRTVAAIVRNARRSA
jgi:hypothetical protein